MEKRRSKRLNVSLNAKLIAGSINCSGVVTNLSEKGICLNITPTSISIDIAPGTLLELEVQHPSGEMIHMHCKLVWLYKSPLKNTSFSAGVDIINPPPILVNYYNKMSVGGARDFVDSV